MQRGNEKKEFYIFTMPANQQSNPGKSILSLPNTIENIKQQATFWRKREGCHKHEVRIEKLYLELNMFNQFRRNHPDTYIASGQVNIILRLNRETQEI